MEYASSSYYAAPDRRSASSTAFRPQRGPAVRWVKEWVPQELATSGGHCSVFKWVREDALESIRENARELKAQETKPEPTTEILFLCSYEGCGKTFVDVGALRKHSHVHAERQHVCHYAGCGKKFLDSSKLKRHFLTHTGERDFVCPYEGCGKAFSLDFNLKSHMKTHSADNYHACPFQGCGKRFINDSKLVSHVKQYHDKSTMPDAGKQQTPPEKPQVMPKSQTPSSDRPFACPYSGCDKAYIHEYKLNLHLRREHLVPEENDKQFDSNDHDAAFLPKTGASTNSKKSKLNAVQKTMPPTTGVKLKLPSLALPTVGASQNQWPGRDVWDGDSEETEEDQDDVDEETDYEE